MEEKKEENIKVSVKLSLKTIDYVRNLFIEYPEPIKTQSKIRELIKTKYRKLMHPERLSIALKHLIEKKEIIKTKKGFELNKLDLGDWNELLYGKNGRLMLKEIKDLMYSEKDMEEEAEGYGKVVKDIVIPRIKNLPKGLNVDEKIKKILGEKP